MKLITVETALTVTCLYGQLSVKPMGFYSLFDPSERSLPNAAMVNHFVHPNNH